MKLTIATVCYCCVMLFVSSFHNATIFDPFVFLWVFCLFIGGPLLVLRSIFLLVFPDTSRSWWPARLLRPLLCLVLVSVWSVGFWRIGDLLRPLVFERVAKDDERLAVSFMQQHPPDTDVEVSGFRYPYFSLFPSGSTTVRHHAGVVSVRVPGGPGTADFLVYVSPGSSLPYSPPTEDSMGQGFEIKPLTESWYYVHAVGI